MENPTTGLMIEDLQDCVVRRKGHSTMSRFALLSISIVLLCGGGFLLSLNGCGGGSATFTAPPPPSSSKIQHVVIIFQENRTPDNLFQGLCAANGGVPGCGTDPGQYDIVGSGVNLQFTGAPNCAYVLQTTTNLASPTIWQPVITNSTDVNGNWSFTDTNANQYSQRFYRASQ